MKPDHAVQPVLRCAIYTRKSTDEGLHKEINSLEAQRDTCSAYIRSQRHKGWLELPQHYDDGGFSGGTLSRPALQQLLADVEGSRVDVVVIYKIDRLTRSLTDFVRLMDLLERFGVSFVSITQAFDTSDSMGRLILNVLLTFAQFERELIGDRLRDKFAVMKRRGKWIGGRVPFGYKKIDKKLVVFEPEAEIVRGIYDRYPAAGSGNKLLRQLQAEGVHNKVHTTRTGKLEGGHLFGPGILHRILTNPLYLGKIVQGDTWYEGEHAAIITREQWDRVQEARKLRHECQIPRQPSGALLLGILYDAHGRRMHPDVQERSGRSYCYYATELTREGQRQNLKVLRTNAEQVEALAITAIRTFLSDRPAVSDALSVLGSYEDETERRLRGAGRIAAHIERMDRPALRQLFQAIIRRAELDRNKLRLFLSCYDIARLLAWDRVGFFKPGAQVPSRELGRVHVVDAPATIVRENGSVKLPVRPAEPELTRPADLRLVALLQEADRAKADLYSNRSATTVELARRRGCGPSHFARLVQISYLAPDIVAAILDGMQPISLTRGALLRSAIPQDWGQQRVLLGFTPLPKAGQRLSATARNHAPRTGGLASF